MNWRAVIGWFVLACVMLFVAALSLTGSAEIAIRTVGYIGGGFGVAGAALGAILATE